MIKSFLFALFAFLAGSFLGVYIRNSEPTLGETIVNPIVEVAHLRKPEVFGFLPYWLIPKAADTYAKNLTTLAYFSVSIGPDAKIQKLINDVEEEPGWTTLKKSDVTDQFAAEKNKNLKTSLVVFAQNEREIGELIASPEAHAKNLIEDVAPIMREHGMSDLNIDIEPVLHASESARANFSAFVREVKSQMLQQNLGTLSIDVTVSSLFLPKMTDAKVLGEIVDHMIIMAYDFHYVGSEITGPISPIGGFGKERIWDVSAAIKKAKEIVPAEKILLGIPTYGYEWETISDAIGAPTIPRTGATASNRRVAELLATCTNCTKGFDEVAQESYVIYPEGNYFNQIYYTDARSLQDRTDLAKEMNIGGVAIWALGYEDPETLSVFETYKKL